MWKMVQEKSLMMTLIEMAVEEETDIVGQTGYSKRIKDTEHNAGQLLQSNLRIGNFNK